MHATVYSFERAASRKRRRGASPAPARADEPFASQLERLLERLGGFRLRISLARLPGGQAIVGKLRDPCAVVGTMPDGSIVAAFLGPRGDSMAADAEMTNRIHRRFRRALRKTEAAFKANALDDLTVAHCWSDEVFDLSSLVLDTASEHRLVHLSDESVPARRQPA